MAAGVSLLDDVHYTSSSSSSGSAGNSAEHQSEMESVSDFGPRFRIPTAKYTKVGETLRHVIPSHMQCSMACGGRACKYENPSRWTNEEQAIKGLYSSWITDNLLAMARPSTEIIEKYNVIEQFLRSGLKTVINLQRPGEHASCGYSLEPESGFTYHPEVFMQAGIYFYNFGWKDYGVASLTTILDMVKVMSFAVQEGKMAIHCHAGLGRTGVLLACYLVFTARMSADQAILFVRAKRPSSIQTRGQLLCVREFARFVAPLHCVFSNTGLRVQAATLSQYLTRQRHLLHGYEARQMKHVPKIVHLICRLLLDIAENRQVTEERNLPELADLTAEVEKTVSQQALQQLGKELRGKGIPVMTPRSLQPCTPPFECFELLGHFNTANAKVQSLCRLSFSDSALHTLSSRTGQYGWRPGHAAKLPRERFVSQNRLSLESPVLHTSRLLLTPESCSSPKSDSPAESFTSLNEAMKAPEEAPCSPLIRKRVLLKEVKHSRSLDLHQNSGAIMTDCQRNGMWNNETRLKQGNQQPFTHHGVSVGGDVPFLILQPELSPDARRVLVAKSLAMDIEEENLQNSISAWQAELNSREGAWEKLCMERDPLLLASLMWSWLDHLKEPVLTKEDIEALTHSSHESQNVLNILDKGQKQTLLCILDCTAHLMKLPGEVETAVLHRTIKAFTRINNDSEKGHVMYKSLMKILTSLLSDIRRKGIELLS